MACLDDVDWLAQLEEGRLAHGYPPEGSEFQEKRLGVECHDAPTIAARGADDGREEADRYLAAGRPTTRSPCGLVRLGDQLPENPPSVGSTGRRAVRFLCRRVRNAAGSWST